MVYIDYYFQLAAELIQVKDETLFLNVLAFSAQWSVENRIKKESKKGYSNNKHAHYRPFVLSAILDLFWSFSNLNDDWSES